MSVEAEGRHQTILDYLGAHLRKRGFPIESVQTALIEKPVSASRILLMPALELRFILASDQTQETDEGEGTFYRPVYWLRGSVAKRLHYAQTSA